MRALALLLPIFSVVVACAGSTASSEDNVEGTAASEVSRGCSKSRSTILASVTGGRKSAITRGFTWLDGNVQYSQSKTHGGYRTDCSGFVSMCWQAGTPGETSSTFATSSDFGFLGSYNDLLPGDAIDDPGHHIVLFLGWDDSAHAGACVLEQASTASDMQFRVRTTASLKSGGYKPLRPDTFKESDATTVDRSGTTADAGANADAGDTEAPSTCVPSTASQACNAASINGVQCGSVSDGCGGQVDCDSVEGFGCAKSQTCSKHLCVAGTADAGTSTTTGGAASESTSDVAAKNAGEPGDESSTRSASNVDSSGCSLAPGSTTRTEAGGLLGLALGLVALLRRRRPSASR